MAAFSHSAVDSREQAARIRQAWANLDKTDTYGGISLAEFETAIAELDSATELIARLEDQLAGARDTQRSRKAALWAMVKRARYGAKAQYGDDSEAFGRFGGIRISERQPPRSKAQA
jgi:hypothetical protein